MANSIQRHLSKKHTCFLLPALLSAALLFSACGKSEVELCIDKQSPLWNTKANSKEENREYWNAVSQCQQKFKK